MEIKVLSCDCGVNLLLWSPNIHDNGLYNSETLACTTWFSLFLCLTNGTLLRKFETVAISNLVSDYSAQKINLTYVIYM